MGIIANIYLRSTKELVFKKMLIFLLLSSYFDRKECTSYYQGIQGMRLNRFGTVEMCSYSAGEFVLEKAAMVDDLLVAHCSSIDSEGKSLLQFFNSTTYNHVDKLASNYLGHIGSKVEMLASSEVYALYFVERWESQGKKVKLTKLDLHRDFLGNWINQLDAISVTVGESSGNVVVLSGNSVSGEWKVSVYNFNAILVKMFLLPENSSPPTAVYETGKGTYLIFYFNNHYHGGPVIVEVNDMGKVLREFNGQLTSSALETDDNPMVLRLATSPTFNRWGDIFLIDAYTSQLIVIDRDLNEARVLLAAPDDGRSSSHSSENQFGGYKSVAYDVNSDKLVVTRYSDSLATLYHVVNEWKLLIMK